ncbi:MAG: hypothetical protein ABI904_00850 [Chloroflexota bacterium]
MNTDPNEPIIVTPEIVQAVHVQELLDLGNALITAGNNDGAAQCYEEAGFPALAEMLRDADEG